MSVGGDSCEPGRQRCFSLEGCWRLACEVLIWSRLARGEGEGEILAIPAPSQGRPPVQQSLLPLGPGGLSGVPVTAFPH